MVRGGSTEMLGAAGVVQEPVTPAGRPVHGASAPACTLGHRPRTRPERPPARAPVSRTAIVVAVVHCPGHVAGAEPSGFRSAVARRLVMTRRALAHAANHDSLIGSPNTTPPLYRPSAYSRALLVGAPPTSSASPMPYMISI